MINLEVRGPRCGNIFIMCYFLLKNTLLLHKMRFVWFFLASLYQSISKTNLAHQGCIGYAGWLVTQKNNVGSHVFLSLSDLAYKSRPKYIFSRNMFFKRHFNLKFHCVLVCLYLRQHPWVSRRAPSEEARSALCAYVYRLPIFQNMFYTINVILLS